MDKSGIVTFSDWNKGMVKHPIYGFGLLKNVEVFENKGIACLKNRAVDSGFTFTALPSAEVYDIYGNTYTFQGEVGASVGAIYKNGNTVLQSGLTLPWDIKIYKDYLWVSYSSVLSCYGPLSSASAQWFGNVGTGYSSTSSGNLLVGQDDYLYRAIGNGVVKLDITGTGVVGVAPSVAINTTLDLPDGQYVTSMIEYGTKLVVGTCGSNSYVTRGSLPVARLYSWNRQAGTLGNPGLADLPVVFNESGINAIIQHANKLYVSAGTQGNIYVTDATNYLKIATLPYSTNGVFYSSSIFYNAISISPRGTLLLGVSGTESDLTNPGVYEIDLNESQYPISYRTPSSITNNAVSKIGFINSKDYQNLRVGWQNGSTYGLDDSDFRMYASYGGVIETPLVKVGGFNKKHTFQHIEWSLAEPLVSGQNLRISYRKNNREDWTLINTWGYGTQGAVLSFEDIAAIVDAEYVQLKIELDQALTTLYGYNINLISVSIW